MPSRQPLPGVLPSVERGDRVRVTIGAVRVDGVTCPRTALGFALGAPEFDGETWRVRVVGYGMVPANRVEVQP